MTLTIVAEPRYGLPPGMKITITGTTSGGDPVPAESTIDLIRIHTDGSRHQVLTEAQPVMSGGVWPGVDYHAPFNQAVRYEATAAGVVATSVAARVVSDWVWLVPPSTPALAVRVETVAEIDDRKVPSRAGKFPVIGGNTIYLSDAGHRPGMSSQITVRIKATDEPAMRKLLYSDQPILINTPNQPGWDLSWHWVQPDSVQYSNPGKVISYPYRYIQIPFDECEDPDIDLTTLWTSQDAADEFSTSATVATTFSTSFNLQSNSRLV